MPAAATTRRVIALQLLLALPIVSSGRLALDARWATGAEDRVEAEHADCCPGAHDHRLCALLFQTPLAVPDDGPNANLAAPPAQRALINHSINLEDEARRLEVARSPPLSS